MRTRQGFLWLCKQLCIGETETSTAFIYKISDLRPYSRDAYGLSRKQGRLRIASLPKMNFASAESLHCSKENTYINMHTYKQVRPEPFGISSLGTRNNYINCSLEGLSRTDTGGDAVALRNAHFTP